MGAVHFLFSSSDTRKKSFWGRNVHVMYIQIAVHLLMNKHDADFIGLRFCVELACSGTNGVCENQ